MEAGAPGFNNLQALATRVAPSNLQENNGRQNLGLAPTRILDGSDSGCVGVLNGLGGLTSKISMLGTVVGKATPSEARWFVPWASQG